MDNVPQIDEPPCKNKMEILTSKLEALQKKYSNLMQCYNKVMLRNAELVTQLEEYRVDSVDVSVQFDLVSKWDATTNTEEYIKKSEPNLQDCESQCCFLLEKDKDMVEYKENETQCCLLTDNTDFESNKSRYNSIEQNVETVIIVEDVNDLEIQKTPLNSSVNNDDNSDNIEESEISSDLSSVVSKKDTNCDSTSLNHSFKSNYKLDNTENILKVKDEITSKEIKICPVCKAKTYLIYKSNKTLGLSLFVMTGKGVFVSDVEENSIAHHLAIRSGDLLVQINNISCFHFTDEEVLQLLERSKNPTEIVIHSAASRLSYNSNVKTIEKLCHKETKENSLKSDDSEPPELPKHVENELKCEFKTTGDIKEDLKSAADEALYKDGIIYHDEYGMYYDYNAGYYFYPDRSLYYEPISGVYYSYDETTQEFTFHSQVTPTRTTINDKTDAKTLPDADDAMDIDSEYDSSEDYQKIIIRPPKRHKPTDDLEIFPQPNLMMYAPCIRAMVTESEELPVGTLFIITCAGAIIGQDESLSKNGGVVLKDKNISEKHSEVQYDTNTKRYLIKDLGSCSGTFLNSFQLNIGSISDQYELKNNDIVKIGSTQLEIHIHPGNNTCSSCEPGQVIGKKASKEKKFMSQHDKDRLRRDEVKRLKMKFGLKNMNYVNDEKSINNPLYEDKAKIRRTKVGSDNPYQKEDAPASVDRPISEKNVGHKMMQKMGWVKGQGLGQKKDGINEPVQVRLRLNDSAGLGSGSIIEHANVDSSSLRKSSNWQKARDRFQNIEEVSKNSKSLLLNNKSTNNVSWIAGEVINDSPIPFNETVPAVITPFESVPKEMNPLSFVDNTQDDITEISSEISYV